MILGKKDLIKYRHILNEISPYPWSGKAGGRIQDRDNVPVCSALHATTEDDAFIRQSPRMVEDLLETVQALRNIIIDIGGNPDVPARFNYNEPNLKYANKLHNEDGLSITQAAIELGCDRKALARQMVAAGYLVRSQRDSQEARRRHENGAGRRPGELSKFEALELNDQTLRKR